MNFEYKTLFAIEMARNAGKILIDMVNRNDGFIIETKGLNDFVTSADKAVEEYIVGSIKDKYPEDSLIAEEGDSINNGDIQWIIDPLDGTTNYCFGFPLFSISIGYKDRLGIKGGVVYSPIQNEMFTAERGKGAYLNGEPIYVNQIDEPSKNLITMGFANRHPELWDDYVKVYTQVMPHVIDIRRTGSAALDLCYVASGRCGAYYEPLLKVWDMAAGIVILSEAGGRFTDRNGKELEIENKDYSILATNGLLHDWFLKYTKECR